MTTILLSYNEVLLTARKAAAGAGLPHGVAEEVGRAAVWLSARGVDAVETTVRALDEKGGRAILDGLAAVDALCAGAGPQEVALEEAPATRLLSIGLAGIAADDAGLPLAVDRGDGDAPLPLAQVADAATLPAGRLRLLRLDAADSDAPSGTPRPAPTDAAAHAEALRFAARMYVPASDQSRLRGAGAGITDND